MNYGKKKPELPSEPPNSYANQWLEVDFSASKIHPGNEFGRTIELKIRFRKEAPAINVISFYNGMDDEGQGTFYNVQAGQEEDFFPLRTIEEIKEISDQYFLHFFLNDPEDPDPANHLFVPMWQIPGFNDV